MDNGDLLLKLEVAVIIAAETVRTELDTVDNHANRRQWAKEAFTNPKTAATYMLRALLAANSDLTPAQITGADDSQIQSKVDAAIDIFATG
jgi:hypothetical protein